MTYTFQKMPSPVGPLYIVVDETHVRAVLFENGWSDYRNSCAELGTKLSRGETSLTKKVVRQLTEYLAGKRKSFDLPYRLNGTDFQQQVWSALATIPYGKTISYKEQAAAISRPKATRAVGGTNGRNPICIILPCHRVIGSSGQLTGFGGGIDKKVFLLRHEGAMI